MNYIKNLMAAFSRDEAGAVTIDFVLLCAAVVGIAAAAVPLITAKINAAATGITL